MTLRTADINPQSGEIRVAAVQTLSVTDPPVEFPLEQPGDRAPSSVRHIVCPACEARFLADDEAFSEVEGRRVR